MKAAAGLALALGLTLFLALTFYEGAGDVARAFAAVGFGLFWLALLRLAQTALSGFAWEALLPAPRPSSWVFIKIRLVRESINNLLPVAQVGGDVIGARLLTKFGAPAGLSAASVIVDVLAMTSTQVVFTFIGLVLLLRSGAQPDLPLGVLFGALIMTPALAGFWLAPRVLAMGWLDRLAASVEKRTGWAAVAGLPALREGLAILLSRPTALAATLALHMAIWFVGVLETWLALWMIGEPRSFAIAVTIESMSHVVRALGVFIPGAWGVQEGGYIALCAAFGVSSPSAIALSLVKRMPEYLCGAPGLWLWRRMEKSGGQPAEDGADAGLSRARDWRGDENPANGTDDEPANLRERRDAFLTP